MSDGTEDVEGAYAGNRVPGRMYISKRFPYQGEAEDDPLAGVAARFGWTVQDATGRVEVFDDKGFEVVVRETATRQQLKALFLEEGGAIKVLYFHWFSADGRRIDRECFTLRDEEVGTVLAFLDAIRSGGLKFDGAEGMRFSAELMRQIVGDSGAITALARQNPQLLAEIIRSEVSVPDVVALARRRRVLTEFRDMLDDPRLFAAMRAKHRRPERAWQAFFEANPWIVGGSLAPQFLHSLDRNRLEQVVRGSSIAGAGKRTDALLRTGGALSAIVLAEIKHPGSDHAAGVGLAVDPRRLTSTFTSPTIPRSSHYGPPSPDADIRSFIATVAGTVVGGIVLAMTIAVAIIVTRWAAPTPGHTGYGITKFFFICTAVVGTLANTNFILGHGEGSGRGVSVCRSPCG